MKIQWNKVTWYSKMLAVVVFGLTFLIGYSMGILTQRTVDDYTLARVPLIIEPHQTNVPGSSAPVVGNGQHCGGNMTDAPVCTTGYHCAPISGSHLPFGDVGGTCVAN